MTNASADDKEHRITELEIRIAYQDKTIEDLDGVVRAFTARVETLERLVKDLRENAQHAAPPIGAADEPPPHY